MISEFVKKEPYIIAETAYNHEGDIDYLYQMICEIAELELNAAKFHLLLNPESYMVKNHPLMNEIKKWLFNKNQWNEIIEYSHKKNLDVIALCDDIESIKFINKTHSEIRGIELHATSLNDYFLLKEAAKFNNLVILGVGGSTIDEVQFAINYLKENEKSDILLMYGFQNFPTKYSNINLRKMIKIKNLFDLPIGYADHTKFDDQNNEIISMMAVMMGVPILEKHYTLNPGKKRIDYSAAVGKKKMKKIKELMLLAHKVYGDGNLHMSENEKSYGNTGPMKKAIVAKNIIRKGEKITFNKIWFKRTEQKSTLKQKQLPLILNLKAKKDIKKDEIIDFGKVEYKFKKPNLKVLGLNQKN